jgi:hypothetical protein
VHPQQTVEAADQAATRSVLPAAAAVSPERARDILADDPSAQVAAAAAAAQSGAGTSGAAGGAGGAGAAGGADASGAETAIDPATGQPVDQTAQTEGAGR